MTLDSANVDHDFFTELNPINCYIAGFIGADGCIVKERTLQIRVNEKDEDHLRGLRDCMGSTATISWRKDHTVGFSIPSTQMAADLKRHFNIGPRKSLTLRPPNLKLVTHKKAYINGYLDGDGCFRYGAQTKSGNWKYLILEMPGTSQFIEWVDNNLPEHGKIRKVDRYYVAQWTGRKAFEVYNYLYNPALPILERKWDNRYKIWAPRH
jgi:hypothetical protein